MQVRANLNTARQRLRQAMPTSSGSKLQKPRVPVTTASPRREPPRSCFTRQHFRAAMSSPQSVTSLPSVDDDENATGMLDGELHEPCAVCLEALPQVIFQPCGHAVACKVCADMIFKRARECPMCRCPLKGLVPLPDSQARAGWK